MNSFPTHSRAALFLGAKEPLHLCDMPIPQLDACEALVAIQCATICGSDLHTIKGLRTEKVPSILGHEALGVVVAVGSPPLRDIQGCPLEMGHRVTWSTVVSCSECDRCKAGWPQKCRTVSKYGHEAAVGRNALSGGLAEYILLRQGSAVMRLPSGLNAEVFCPANCATATVAAALRYAQPLEGARVLIIGCGMLGLTAVAMARTMQAQWITSIDRDPVRANMAQRFGADLAFQWNGNPVALEAPLRDANAEVYDVILELSGDAAAVAVACRLCDIGGRVVLVGTVMPSPGVELDPEMLVRRCLSIRGVHNYASQDLVTAINFLKQHGADFPFADLVERSFLLDDIHDAIDYAIQQRPIRVAVYPQINDRIMNTIDEIFGLFEARGGSQYGGEAVTQLQHALQAAVLAERDHASPELIVAALLHDVGHLLHTLPEDSPDEGVDDHHETSAGNYLRKHFPTAVSEPARLHVEAKRYLCAMEPGYLARLSQPSLTSLQLQGGPMTWEEAEKFRQNPYAENAIQLRRWDEEAKDPLMETPNIQHYTDYLQAVLRKVGH